MSRGRHSKPRPPRSDAPLAILVVLLALGVGAAVLLADGLDVLKYAVVALAVLCLLTVLLTRTSGRRAVGELRIALEQSQSQNRSLRFELERVHIVNNELVLEVGRLRAQMASYSTQMAVYNEQLASYVVPVPVVAEPIYPSLHLPLVRAAFAEELQPPTPLPVSSQQVDETSVDLQGGPGSDPRPPRQLLDLTASEIAQLRTAN